MTLTQNAWTLREATTVHAELGFREMEPAAQVRRMIRGGQIGKHEIISMGEQYIRQQLYLTEHQIIHTNIKMTHMKCTHFLLLLCNHEASIKIVHVSINVTF